MLRLLSVGEQASRYNSLATCSAPSPLVNAHNRLWLFIILATCTYKANTCILHLAHTFAGHSCRV